MLHIYKLKEFYYEVKSRWKAKTPIFWKKIQRFGIKCTLVSTLIASHLTKYSDLDDKYLPTIPDYIYSIAGQLGFIGAVITILAQLTKEDSNIEEDK